MTWFSGDHGQHRILSFHPGEALPGPHCSHLQSLLICGSFWLQSLKISFISLGLVDFTWPQEFFCESLVAFAVLGHFKAQHGECEQKIGPYTHTSDFILILQSAATKSIYASDRIALAAILNTASTVFEWQGGLLKITSCFFPLYVFLFPHSGSSVGPVPELNRVFTCSVLQSSF